MILPERQDVEQERTSTQVITCSMTSAAVGKTPFCQSSRSSGRITGNPEVPKMPVKSGFQ